MPTTTEPLEFVPKAWLNVGMVGFSEPSEVITPPDQLNACAAPPLPKLGAYPTATDPSPLTPVALLEDSFGKNPSPSKLAATLAA